MRQNRYPQPRSHSRRPGSTSRRPTPRQAERGAQARLRRFRKGSKAAIGATALLILLFGVGLPDVGRAAGPAAATTASAAPQQTTPPADPAGTAGTAGTADTAADTLPALDTVPEDPGEAARRATGTLRQLGVTVYNALPALGIAIGILLLAGVMAKLGQVGLRLALSSWERAEATAALVSVLIWLLALGAALSVVAGDARALVGSIGLFGLALSWALQAPIESFTGFVLNAFRSYYRVGDRIAVGEVFGDVARIDFLTTTIFEAGGPDKQVRAAQSTGALVTFPNSEILRSNVVNYTRDFPYVWDELTMAVANESDLPTAIQVLERVANEVVGERMEAAADAYAELLNRAHLGWDVATRPEVYVAARDSWTDLTIRYVVPVREMRSWATRLLLALNQALSEPDVAGRVFAAYPRSQVQRVPEPRWAEGHFAEHDNEE